MTYPDDILAAEDKAAAELEKEFLRSVKTTIKQVDWDKLEKDLEDHRAGADIVDGLPWNEYDPEKALKKLFEVALEVHGEYIGSVTGGAIFDYVDPNALKWIEKYCADDVVQITSGTKEAIRSIIYNGYNDGITVRDQAKEIKQLIGLDPNRAEAVQNMRARLLKRGLISDSEINRRAAKYAEKLLMQRANTIAVNETSEAAGQATYQSTRSAVQRGVLDPGLYEAFRIVTADERTCERCMTIEGEARKLPDGTYASTGQQIAKAHVKCRCCEGLREITMKKNEMQERSNEYLGKFLELVKPWILPDKWLEFHKAARGFAGGKGRASKRQESSDFEDVTIEAVQIGPGITRREIQNGIRYIVSPLHLTHEGVANGILKRWEEIYDPEGIDGVDSFEGCLISRGHPLLGMSPETPSLGKLRNIICDTATKRSDAEAWLVEERLTGKEVKALESGDLVAGSLAYNSKKVYLPAPAVWDDGTPYDTEVKRPFRANHYALLDESDTPACPTCGFNAPPESQAQKQVTDYDYPNSEGETKLVLEDGSVKRRLCGKHKQEADNSMAIDAAELKKLFKESFEESVGPLVKRIEALEQKTEAAKPLAEDPTIKALTESVGKLTESLPDIQGFKAQQEAAKVATQRVSFAKQLNAAHTSEGRPEGDAFEKVWAEANKDPLGRDHYLGEHPEIRLRPGKESGFVGRAGSGAEGDFDIAAENAKLYGYEVR